MFPKTLPPLCGIQVCMKGRRTTICLFILAHISRSNNKEWLEELGILGEGYTHYNKSQPASCVEKLAISLETKWGIIKHDVNKFVGDFGSVSFVQVYNKHKTHFVEGLELYKTKHPRNLSITFIHGWLVLKDMPCWGGQQNDEKYSNNEAQNYNYVWCCLWCWWTQSRNNGCWIKFGVYIKTTTNSMHIWMHY